MARPGISYEDVRSAAHTLHDRGEHPSIQRVREYLGTGSNSTIAGHLKRWQEEVTDRSRDLPLPPSLPGALASAVEAFWKAAVDQADSAYRELREAARVEREQAAEQRDRALSERDQALADVESLRRALAECRDQLRSLDRELLLERERRTLAEAAIAHAEQRVAQAGRALEQTRVDARDQVQRLESTLLQVREDANRQAEAAEQRLSDERQRGEESETHLLRMIDRLRTEQNAERKAAAQERKAGEEQIARWRQNLQQQAMALATTQERCRIQETDLLSQRETIRGMEQRALDQTRLIEHLRGKLRRAAAIHGKLEEMLGKAKHQEQPRVEKEDKDKD